MNFVHAGGYDQAAARSAVIKLVNSVDSAVF